MKSYFFKLILNSTCSKLSFEVHNVSVAQKLKFFDFLPRKFFIDDLCLFGDLNRQNYTIEKAVFDVIRKLKVQTLILDQVLVTRWRMG